MTNNTRVDIVLKVSVMPTYSRLKKKAYDRLAWKRFANGPNQPTV